MKCELMGGFSSDFFLLLVYFFLILMSVALARTNNRRWKNVGEGKRMQLKTQVKGQVQ